MMLNSRVVTISTQPFIHKIGCQIIVFLISLVINFEIKVFYSDLIYDSSLT